RSKALAGQPGCSVPAGRTATAGGKERPIAGEVVAQDLAQETLEAVPLALTAAGSEQAGALDAAQGIGRIGASGNGVAEWRTEAIQVTRRAQELGVGGLESAQHLRLHVFRY